MAVKTYAKADLAVKLSANFTVGDLWLETSLNTMLIDLDLVAALEKFRAHFGKPVVFYSKRAVYCKDGHAANSYHYKGQAADFGIEGVAPYKLAQYAEVIGMTGIGLYSDNNKHIHADVRPKSKTCWWIVTTNSKTPGFGGVPTVFKSGHRSYAIKEIQAFLNNSGFPCGSADGSFGPKTEAALKLYQKSAGVTADGAYGPATNKKAKVFNW